MAILKKFRQKLSYDPLIFFLIFGTANTLLAYAPLDFFIKILLGLSFVILPWLVAATSPPSAWDKSFPGSQPSFFPSTLVWLGLGALAVFLRLYQLTSLAVWPMWDDAYNAYFSIRQMQDWSFQAFYTNMALPFLFYWIEAFYFKIIQPSLFSLWLFPELFSILLLPVSYWACRQFFQPSFSFLFTLLMAFSFWPLYLGKFCLSMGLDLIWDLVAFGLLGIVLKSRKRGNPFYALLGLGLWVGIGSFISILTYHTMVLMGFMVVGLCLMDKKSTDRTRNLLAFVVPVLLLFLPMALGTFVNLNKGYLHDRMVYGGMGRLIDQLPLSLSYFTALLWGSLDRSYFNFGPLWGGFFNPLLGSAFLIGWVEWYRSQKKLWFWGAVGIFLFYLIPGALSNGVEIMRTMLVLPFCTLFAALGLWRLMGNFRGRSKIFFLACFLALSLSLDIYHLWGPPFHHWAAPDKNTRISKSVEHYRAFQVIEKWHLDKGPGLVFSDFYYDVFDQSLFVATYGFNAVVNPKLEASQSKWVSVLMASWDQPYFENQFPGAFYYDLSEGFVRGEGGMKMAILPLTEQNRPIFYSWISLHREIQDLYPEYSFFTASSSYKNILSKLWDLYERFSSQPFLRRCLLEKIVDTANISNYIPDPNHPSHPQMAIVFPALEILSRQEGPGVMLFKFRPHETDQTLTLATHRFNAEVNPHILMSQIKWMAVVTDVHYRSFLEQRFPASKWWNLFDKYNPNRQEVNEVLGIIPVRKNLRGILKKWIQADQALQKIVWTVTDLPENSDHRAIFQGFADIYPLFQGDPFLESYFWTKLAENFQKNGQLDHAWHALQLELERGYPFPQKYYLMGYFLFQAKHYHLAREAYLTAARLDPSFTPPPDALKELNQLANAEASTHPGP